MAPRRVYVAGAVTVGMFLLIQLGALALVEPFKAAGYQTVENPQDPVNTLLYVLAILGATVVMLAAFRFGVDRAVQLLVVSTAVFLSLYVFSVLVPPVAVVDVLGSGVNVLAAGGAILLGVVLLVYPEWYVIDAAGIVMGAGAAALFGISFGLLPALLLLVVLAVYDAISVYGTAHMLTLASGVMDQKIPIVLVVPLTASYSYLSADPPIGGDEAAADPVAADDGTAANGLGEEPDHSPSADGATEVDPLERDALFIGLGDAVIPTVLVASAAFFAPGAADLGVPGIVLTVPAVGAVLGTLVGLVTLLGLVVQGRAHAGLPLLNGGAIGGYLLGAVASGVPIAAALGL